MLELKLNEAKPNTDQPMVHYNIDPDTIEKMLLARKQLEEAIMKYEPVIERLEELWETKVLHIFNLDKSGRMGKPTICIGENKGADQLRS